MTSIKLVDDESLSADQSDSERLSSSIGFFSSPSDTKEFLELGRTSGDAG